MTIHKFLGIVVSPEYVDYEGLNQVFDNIESLGADAIAFWPVLIEPSVDGRGGRMPDLHIDGTKRLLARPLWGKRELVVSSYLAYEPDLSLYEGHAYRPPPAPPARIDREIPPQMIAEAKRRGIRVHLGIGPFIPPGTRPQDQPVLIDGSAVRPPYIARNVCVNNPHGQKYALAAIEDMLKHYPDVDGLILDWVEFGVYKLEDNFTCFCSHCRRTAGDLGFDWEQILRDVTALWDLLHDLTLSELERAHRLPENPSELLELLIHHPGWLPFLQFKAQSVVSFYTRVRKLMDDLGLQEAALTARGWCPPWNLSSGSDYRALAGVCGSISPKLFTFDHAVLPRRYGQTLQSWNPELPEAMILDTLIAWMNLPDDFAERNFDLYHIPAPEESHPARLGSYQYRLEEVASQIGGRASLYPISHPYIADNQWQDMVALIHDSPADGMWVNMYGYLSDPKLEILKQAWS